MKVTKYLKSNQIKYFPIKIDGKTPKGGLNDYGSHYNEFNTINEDELKERQTKNKEFPLVALNTFEQVILDVDDVDAFKEAFPKIEQKLREKCINYKSRNKRLPHYLIKLINKPQENDQKRYAIEGGDLLTGQWAWLKRNETIEDKLITNQLLKLIITIWSRTDKNRNRNWKKKKKQKKTL